MSTRFTMPSVGLQNNCTGLLGDTSLPAIEPALKDASDASRSNCISFPNWPGHWIIFDARFLGGNYFTFACPHSVGAKWNWHQCSGFKNQWPRHVTERTLRVNQSFSQTGSLVLTCEVYFSFPVRTKAQTYICTTYSLVRYAKLLLLNIFHCISRVSPISTIGCGAGSGRIVETYFEEHFVTDYACTDHVPQWRDSDSVVCWMGNCGEFWWRFNKTISGPSITADCGYSNSRLKIAN